MKNLYVGAIAVASFGLGVVVEKVFTKFVYRRKPVAPLDILASMSQKTRDSLRETSRKATEELLNSMKQKAA